MMAALEDVSLPRQYQEENVQHQPRTLALLEHRCVQLWEKEVATPIYLK
jgi:hypothetical protein